jgi:hypothetical protein
LSRGEAQPFGKKPEATRAASGVFVGTAPLKTILRRRIYLRR